MIQFHSTGISSTVHRTSWMHRILCNTQLQDNREFHLTKNFKVTMIGFVRETSGCVWAGGRLGGGRISGGVTVGHGSSGYNHYHDGQLRIISCLEYYRILNYRLSAKDVTVNATSRVHYLHHHKIILSPIFRANFKDFLIDFLGHVSCSW